MNTCPVVPVPDNYKSVIYTKEQLEMFKAATASVQRGFSFFLNSFSFFDVASHMIDWPESPESQEAKDYAFFCFYNKQNNEEKKEDKHKFFTMTRHCFDNPFIIRGLIVGSELFFFSKIEHLGTCQIHFDQDAKSFFCPDFYYENGSIADFMGGPDQKLELVGKIKTSLEKFFHAPQD